MTEERRALLESIAFGGDSSIKPGERLRALELLDREQPDRVCFCGDLAHLNGDELHAMEDALMAALLIARDDESRRAVWPQLMAALDHELDRRQD